MKRFDFETFDSEISKELKENSMFYDAELDGIPPGLILVEVTEVPELTE